MTPIWKTWAKMRLLIHLTTKNIFFFGGGGGSRACICRNLVTRIILDLILLNRILSSLSCTIFIIFWKIQLIKYIFFVLGNCLTLNEIYFCLRLKPTGGKFWWMGRIVEGKIEKNLNRWPILSSSVKKLHEHSISFFISSFWELCFSSWFFRTSIPSWKG